MQGQVTSGSPRVPPLRKPPAGRQRICSDYQFRQIDPIWMPGPVPQNWWDDDDNCRNYLYWLAHKLHLRYMEDWYRVTYRQILCNHGARLLQIYGAQFKVLTACYPQYEWHEWRFPRLFNGFWRKTKNRKRYYAWLGERLGYREPADWRRLSFDDLRRHRGGTLLTILPSLGHIRHECCPEIEVDYKPGPRLAWPGRWTVDPRADPALGGRAFRQTWELARREIGHDL